ncbi:hypothetical protein [Sulfitobacter mediterraneus]|uniref:hypothetical protein n=1 Tax=Sulfitobacter mediterraneus TaxID=83219 RepID=UPI002492647C|nr:hypothetical protein [Sulfitobacter mediterraneus]
MSPLKPYEVFRPTLLAEADPDVDYLQAIQDFASQRIEAISKSIIYQMQRIDSVGVFEGEAPKLRSLWDEWCWYQHRYGSDCGSLSQSFEMSLNALIEGTVEELGQAEAVLLSTAIAEDQTDMPNRSDDEISAVVRDVITEAAGYRSMSRFEIY